MRISCEFCAFIKEKKKSATMSPKGDTVTRYCNSFVVVDDVAVDGVGLEHRNRK